MASSGTFTSKRYGTSYGPWLTLAWTQVSQSIANNTTTLDLTLRFHWGGNIAYTFYNRTGSVQGNSYTYSGSASGTSGSLVLRTQRVTISHNSNGTKSLTLSGNISTLGLNWSGINIGAMSVSGSANLNTIPRASTLSKFSFNAHLKNDTANKINYTIDRKSTGFRHQIQLRDGNTVLRTWDNVDSNGASTLALTSSEVNTLLNRMSKTTTKSYTLRIATRSGVNGGWIGSAVSKNGTATVHADVKPTVSAVTLSQTGNPVSTHTLQGYSKIKASFTRSAGYGASISSSSIQVRRRSGGADSQTINSNSGTTSKTVSLNGVYEARGTTRDSRGRTTNTAWATITVTAYSAPTITNFSAVRDNSEPEPEPTKVNISRATTHTVLGTSNHLTYTIQRRQGTGAWTNVNTGATGTVTTSGATGSATSTGNSVTQSYDFRLVVTDKLGGKAESFQSVTTQREVLDIHKNEGVGIGKIHEEGVLDVDGSAYFAGEIDVEGLSYFKGGLEITPTMTSTTRFRVQSKDPNGHGYLEWQGSDDRRKGWVGIGGVAYDDFSVYSEMPAGLNLGTPQGRPVTVNKTEIIQRGRVGDHHWARFYDGTQICHGTVKGLNLVTSSATGTLYRTPSNSYISYAMDFFESPAVEVNQGSIVIAFPAISTSPTQAVYRWYSPHNNQSIKEVTYVAVGRWK